MKTSPLQNGANSASCFRPHLTKTLPSGSWGGVWSAQQHSLLADVLLPQPPVEQPPAASTTPAEAVVALSLAGLPKAVQSHEESPSVATPVNVATMIATGSAAAFTVSCSPSQEAPEGTKEMDTGGGAQQPPSSPHRLPHPWCSR